MAQEATKKNSVIDYEMLSEKHDDKTKVYEAEFEIWSIDKEANELSLAASSESKNVQILTKKKIWRGEIAPLQKFKHLIQIGLRKDSRKISIMVAP
jgi:hypothetical protein